MKPGMWVVLAVLGCVVWLLVWSARQPPRPDVVPGAGVVGLVPAGDPVEARTPAGNRQLIGRVRNDDTQTRTGRVQITLFDAGGAAIGAVEEWVQNVPPGGEGTYSPFIGATTPAWSRLEVRVVTQRRVDPT